MEYQPYDTDFKMEKLVPVQTVAEYLAISPKMVYHWVQIGFIPHYRLPKAVRFKMDEVENWLGRKKKNGRPNVSFGG